MASANATHPAAASIAGSATTITNRRTSALAVVCPSGSCGVGGAPGRMGFPWVGHCYGPFGPGGGWFGWSNEGVYSSTNEGEREILVGLGDPVRMGG